MRRLLTLPFALLATASLLMAAPASATFPSRSAEVIGSFPFEGAHALVSIRFDPVEGHLPLFEFILPGRDLLEPAWSPDGGSVAFAGQTRANGPFAIYTVQADGTGLKQVTSPVPSGGADHGDHKPTWSPDGTKIAFSRTGATGSKLYVVPAGGGTASRLTTGSGVELEPTWSPDGTTIAFAYRARTESGCGLPCTFQIALVSATSPAEPRTITANNPFDFRDPDWAPDGSSIAVGVWGDGLQLVASVDPETSFFDFIPTAGGADPVWSPEGDWIAVEFGGGTVVDHLGEFDDEFIEVTDPAWRPDGTPPTVTFEVSTDLNGWATSNPTMTASDPSGIFPVIHCTLFGTTAVHDTMTRTFTDLIAGISLDRDGIGDLTCEVADLPGNITVATVPIKVDFNSPDLGAPTFSPDPLRVGATTVVSATAVDAGSGVVSSEMVVDDGEAVPLTLSAGRVSGTLGPLPVGLHQVAVTATDAVGLIGGPFASTLAVYDPDAGSLDGNGAFFPGGSSSEPEEELPACDDGVSRTTIAVSIRYRNSTSTAPTGSMSLSCGKKLKVQSTAFSWLIVDGSHIEALGAATISGLSGVYGLRLVVEDSATDHVRIQLFTPGFDPLTSRHQYQASGDLVSGGLRVRR